MHMVKDDWPPPPGMTEQARISPKMFKFRFSLHMVKDDWPPSIIQIFDFLLALGFT